MYTFIETNHAFDTNVVELQEEQEIALDLETTGLDPHADDVLLIQLGIKKGNKVLIYNARKLSKENLTYLFDLIETSDKLVVGHNVKFDAKFVLAKYGVNLSKLYDTQEAEKIYQAGIHKRFYSFKELVNKYFKVNIDKEIRESFIGKEDAEFTAEQLEYASDDVKYLIPLKEKQEKKIKASKMQGVWDLEMKLMPAVVKMEVLGVPFDVDSWKEVCKQVELDIIADKQKLDIYLFDNFDALIPEHNGSAAEVADNLFIPLKTKKQRTQFEEVLAYNDIASLIITHFNWNSPKQALRVFHLLGVETTTTDKKILANQFSGHEVVKLLLNYRETSKKLTSFGEAFLEHVNPVTGRIHSNFNQLVARTGRFTSDDPNLQNITSESVYRHSFKAKAGKKMITRDYSQVELRLAAEISGEEKMISAFLQGLDMHAFTASLIFNVPLEEVTDVMRKIGKTLNFAVIYGITAMGMWNKFGIPKDEAQEYLDRFFEQYPILAGFIKAVGDQVLKIGYSKTLYGRKRFFTIPKTPTRKDLFTLFPRIRRQAFNHIIQGTSADMMKLAIYFAWKNNPFGDRFNVVLTVHDEMVGECDEEIENEASEYMDICMIDAGKLFLKKIPVETDVVIAPYWSKS